MKQLIYVSFARERLNDAQLDALLEKSRRNNQAKSLTGMLLYRDGDFLQILEGEADTVDAAFRTIASDARHGGVMVLDESVIQERTFEDWSMGFRRLDDEGVPEGFVDFFDRRFDEETVAARGSEAVQFLSSFKAIAH